MYDMVDHVSSQEQFGNHSGQQDLAFGSNTANGNSLIWQFWFECWRHDVGDNFRSVTFKTQGLLERKADFKQLQLGVAHYYADDMGEAMYYVWYVYQTLLQTGVYVADRLQPTKVFLPLYLLPLSYANTLSFEVYKN